MVHSIVIIGFIIFVLSACVILFTKSDTTRLHYHHGLAMRSKNGKIVSVRETSSFY